MSNVLTVKREYQMQEWAQKVRECQASGLSKKDWCEKNGIALKTYYYHLNKLREKALKLIDSAKAPELVEINLQHEQPAAMNTKQIRIRYHDSELDIPSGTNKADIVAVLEAIKSI